MLHFLLRSLTDADLADAMLGDLEQERRRRAARSAMRACVWFWGVAAGLAVYAGIRRVRETLGSLAAAIGSGGGRPGLGQVARSLRRAPWYSVTIIGVSALVMALATVVFAVVDGVLFKPLPYADAHELVGIQPGFSDPTLRGTPSASPHEIRAWAEALPDVAFTGFDDNEDSGLEGVNETGLGLAVVQANFFDVLGIRPLIGGFRSEHFETNPSPLPIVISYQFWQRRFASNPAILGEIVDVDPRLGGRFVVAGVLPRDFVFPSHDYNVQVLLPLTPAFERRANRQLRVIARLPSDQTPELFHTRFEATLGRLLEGQPLPSGRDRWFGPFDRADVRPLADRLARPSRPVFAAVFAGVAILVLIGCVNVSGLMAARSLDRARELGLRRALGARGWHITKSVVAENAVLLGAGAAIGSLAASPLLRITLQLLPSRQLLLKTPAIDWRVAAFVGLALIVVLALASLWPVRCALRAQLPAGGGAGSGAAVRTRSTARSMAIAAQIAGATVLDIGGALLVGSLLRATANDPGYAPDDLAMVHLQVVPDETGTSALQGDAAVRARLAAVLERVRRVPGVAAAGAADARVLERSSIDLVAFPPPPGVERMSTLAVPVTEGFFAAAELPLVAGRLPSDAELSAGASVIVVSEQVAAGYWPNESPVGQVLTGRRNRGTPEPFEIVGVVGEAAYDAWDEKPLAVIYTPYSRHSGGSAPVVFVRARDQIGVVLADVLRVVDDQGPAVRAVRAATAYDMLADSIRARRFSAWLSGAFATAATLIVALGILGLLAMTAARRTRETGIRMALGATRDRVVGALVAEQLAPLALGLAAGVVLSIWVAGTLSAHLYELTPYDVQTWLVAVAVIAAAALGGALLPALRAGRRDPVSALRVD